MKVQPSLLLSDLERYKEKHRKAKFSSPPSLTSTVPSTTAINGHIPTKSSEKQLHHPTSIELGNNRKSDKNGLSTSETCKIFYRTFAAVL